MFKVLPTEYSPKNSFIANKRREQMKMFNEYYNIKHPHLNESKGIYRKEDKKFRSFGASLLGLPHDYNNRNGEFVQIYQNFPDIICLHKTYHNIIPEIENLHVYYMHSFKYNTECISVNDEVSKYEFIPNSVENYVVSANNNKIISVSIILLINPMQNKLQDFLQTTFYNELNHIIYMFKSNISIEDLNGDSKYALEGLSRIDALALKNGIKENSYIEFERKFFEMMYYCNRSELCAYLENIYSYLEIYKNTLNKNDINKSDKAKLEILVNINDTTYIYYTLFNELKSGVFESNHSIEFWQLHKENLGKIYSKTNKVRYSSLLSLFKSRIKTFLHKAIKLYDDVLETL